MNTELVRIVVEDLEYLAEHWVHVKEIDIPTLRRGSAILRRWLTDENLLSVAWREVGFKKTPYIECVVLDKARSDPEISKISLATSGTRHNPMSGVISGDISLLHVPMPHFDTVLRFPSFAESTSIIVSGVPIRRMEVVKIIANHMGGVHYGVRPSNERKLMELLNGDLVGGDANIKSIRINDLPPIYSELRNIAIDIITSKDIQTFLEKSQELMQNFD